MSNRFKNLSQLVLLAFIITVCIISDAKADDDVFASVTEKAQEIFQNLKAVIFVLGSFGLIGFSVGAIFGKVQWKWFATLSFGLFIISVADNLVAYITEDPATAAAEYPRDGDFGDGGLSSLDFGDTW